MQSKKTKKANVGRNSSLYFAVGLALMLFLANRAINHKSYEEKTIEKQELNLDALDDEEIPITELLQKQPPPPPPPPPVVQDQLDVVEDDEDVVEDVIESTEVDQDDVIPDVAVEDVATGPPPVEEPTEVPFAVIEDIPVFPGCEKKKGKAAKRECMTKKITKIIQRKFNTDLAGDLGLSGRQRIDVFFKIGKDGKVTGIKTRGPHPGLEKEAKRVFSLIPQMQPGKQRGKPVTVTYAMPIIFVVQ